MQTTERTPHAAFRRAAHVVADLLAACESGALAYRAAAADAHDTTCRALFAHLGQQRVRFASALAAMADRLGGVAGARHGAHRVSEALRRGWYGLRAALEGGTDAAIVAQCERAEGATVSAYESALETFLPREAETLVRGQLAAIVEARFELGRLRAALA